MNKYFLFPKSYNRASNFEYYRKVLSPPEIEKIINSSSELEYEIAEVGYGLDQQARNSSIKWIPTEKEWDWLYQKLMTMAVQANQEFWEFDLHSLLEKIQYTEYNVGGHFQWHMDVGSGSPSLRKISATIQLSDPSEYEGGELQFFIDGEYVTPPNEQGSMTIFPSYLYHRVNKVTKGTRRSLVFWCGGDHYR